MPIYWLYISHTNIKKDDIATTNDIHQNTSLVTQKLGGGEGELLAIHVYQRDSKSWENNVVFAMPTELIPFSIFSGVIVRIPGNTTCSYFLVPPSPSPHTRLLRRRVMRRRVILWVCIITLTPSREINWPLGGKIWSISVFMTPVNYRW